MIGVGRERGAKDSPPSPKLPVPKPGSQAAGPVGAGPRALDRGERDGPRVPSGTGQQVCKLGGVGSELITAVVGWGVACVG